MRFRLESPVVGVLVLALTVVSCGDGAFIGTNGDGAGGDRGAGGSTGPSGIPRPDFSDLMTEIPAPLDAAADADPGGVPALIRLYLTQLNGYTAWTAFLNQSIDGGPGIIQTETSATWSVGDLTYTLEYRPSVPGDERNTDWRFYKDGDDGAFRYDNELFIDAYYEPLVGAFTSFGRWLEVYDPNQTEEAARVWRVGFQPEGVLAFHRRGDLSIFLLEFTDGTFFFEYQTGGEPDVSAEWDAAGNGTWTRSESGAPVETGTF